MIYKCQTLLYMLKIKTILLKINNHRTLIQSYRLKNNNLNVLFNNSNFADQGPISKDYYISIKCMLFLLLILINKKIMHIVLGIITYM